MERPQERLWGKICKLNVPIRAPIGQSIDLLASTSLHCDDKNLELERGTR
jgi:hypothetical protein